MPDGAWVKARINTVLAGNIEAFGDLVAAFQSPVRGYISMCGIPTDRVEDLAQDTFIAAFKALKTYDPQRPMIAWLRGIAQNTVMQYRTEYGNELRKLQRIREFLMVAEIPSDALEEDERFDIRRLRECLKKLPAQAATVVQQRYFEGLNSTQIAERSGQTSVSVRMMLTRVRVALKKCVSQRLPAEGAS